MRRRDRRPRWRPDRRTGDAHRIASGWWSLCAYLPRPTAPRGRYPLGGGGLVSGTTAQPTTTAGALRTIARSWSPGLAIVGVLVVLAAVLQLVPPLIVRSIIDD